MKKFFAALAASAMALSVMGISAFASPVEDNATEIPEEEEEIVLEDEVVEPEEEEVIEEVEPEEPEAVEELEPVEETVVEPVEEETVEETAPVESASSPATGNSPIAMAVIPVALAAAAVVAKKSK